MPDATYGGGYRLQAAVFLRSPGSSNAYSNGVGHLENVPASQVFIGQVSVQQDTTTARTVYITDGVNNQPILMVPATVGSYITGQLLIGPGLRVYIDGGSASQTLFQSGAYFYA